MKNFSDLLATEQHLAVSINNTTYSVGWAMPLEFSTNDQVTVDGEEILPKYRHLAVNGKLTIPEPFYRWYHRVSGQGWLLTPQ
jgi:glutaredoxin 2